MSLATPVTSHTVQTVNLPCIRRIPKMHSWIENKFMLRLFLCILGLLLPPNFTLSLSLFADWVVSLCLHVAVSKQVERWRRFESQMKHQKYVSS
jgi:hypothetical protein